MVMMNNEEMSLEEVLSNHKEAIQRLMKRVKRLEEAAVMHAQDAEQPIHADKHFCGMPPVLGSASNYMGYLSQQCQQSFYKNMSDNGE
jgi:hypothetical protein